MTIDSDFRGGWVKFCQLLNGKAASLFDGESLALKFLNLADLPKLMPNDRPVLEKFQEYKKSGEFQLF
ncbi:hypothetical protein [Nostoc sp.]|uniref:hypothetical protein n=1 Tax=Nostoc sp. TaxID=1180 RepID=UPI002FF8F6B8